MAIRKLNGHLTNVELKAQAYPKVTVWARNRPKRNIVKHKEENINPPTNEKTE
jgi:hypothetical protein